MKSSLSKAVRHAGHSAAAAPRILRAARDAGASTLESARVLGLSTAVLLDAARRAGTRPRRENAIRHFAWQALLTARHGLAVAEAVAAANEVGSTDAQDSAIDEHNNAAGRAWGSAQADTLSGVSLPRALRRAFEEATRQWDEGELARS